jgi:hypothetical protein
MKYCTLRNIDHHHPWTVPSCEAKAPPKAVRGRCGLPWLLRSLRSYTDLSESIVSTEYEPLGPQINGTNLQLSHFVFKKT